jgi:hypothetical protein
MPAPACSDVDFVGLFETLGALGTASRLDINVRNVFTRRRRLEARLGRALVGPEVARERRSPATHPDRIEIAVRDGVVLVGSDGHYWPGPASTAHRAFVRFCEELEPALVVMNGDVVDGAALSPHPPAGWESGPSLVEEIEAARERLAEIRLALPPHIRTIWTLGNHDARFEGQLARVAPEYANVRGVELIHHFEGWEPSFTAFINDTVVVKHRLRGGIHAAHNNVMWAGRTMLTGHTHALKVEPISDYGGTRFGIECGMLANPAGPQFRYLEDAPVNWRSGFVVLTFRDGRLQWPEIVHVMDSGRVDFRGRSIAV